MAYARNPVAAENTTQSKDRVFRRAFSPIRKRNLFSQSERGLWLSIAVAGMPGCFQRVDTGAAGQVLAVSGDAGTVTAADAGIPVLLQTPPIVLDANNKNLTTTDPCQAITYTAQQIRQTYCAGCHNGANALGAPLTFILDDSKLVTAISSPLTKSTRYVIPGDPPNSLIYQRVAVLQDMPPVASDVTNAGAPRPTVSDCSVLEQWIMCLAGRPDSGAGGSSGISNTGGSTSAGGSSGISNMGGSTSAGANAVIGGSASGGTPSHTGGSPATGGTRAATGGALAASGGVIASTGGTLGATGGALLGSGGRTARGGAPGSTGGVVAAGGESAGGASSLGGSTNRGGTTGVAGSAGTGGRATGGTSGTRVGATGGATGVGDTSRYNFETSTQGWVGLNQGEFTSVVSSTAEAFAGLHSLAATIAATSAVTYDVGIAPPAIAPGTAITFHVFLPSGALIDWIQPYVQGASSFTGNYLGSPSMGIWITLTVTVPTTAGTVTRIGVQFNTSGAWNGVVYVDSVNW